MAIGIVTAFFDIGREDWAKRPNTPAWLARSTEDYFACFERMCRLENEIVVFTQSKFAERIAAARAKLGFSNQTRIVCKDDLFEDHGVDLGKITRVMNMPGFLAGVTHPHCPEYWEPRYVLINYLKSFFACEAIEQGLVGKRISCLGRFRLLPRRERAAEIADMGLPVFRQDPSFQHRETGFARPRFHHQDEQGLFSGLRHRRASKSNGPTSDA